MTTLKQRDAAIVGLREAGLTLAAIGQRYNMTRERVRQIYDRHERALATARRAEELQAASGAQAKRWAGLLLRIGRIGRQLTTIATELNQIDAKLNEGLVVPINGLELSSRAAAALKHCAIDNLREVTEWSEADLRRLPNVGKLTIQEIKEVLAKFGLSLSERPKFTHTEWQRFVRDQPWAYYRSNRSTKHETAAEAEPEAENKQLPPRHGHA